MNTSTALALQSKRRTKVGGEYLHSHASDVFPSVSTAHHFRRFMYVLSLNNRRLSEFDDRDSISTAVTTIHGPTGQALSLVDVRKVKLNADWMIPQNLD